MTAVQLTVSAICSAPRLNLSAGGLDDVVVTIIDAMREGVVALDGYPLRASALKRKHEGVVGTSVSVVGHNNIGIVLTQCRILQRQNAPLVGVSDRRTRGTRVHRVRKSYTVQEAVPVCIADAGNEDSRIGFVAVQHMNDAAADVVSGNQPIHPKLALKAQVPLVDVRLFQIEGKHGVN